MASNLRVDNILPSNGTNIGIGTANGSVTFLGDTDISTTGDVIIAGNLGVGGTITYEDVARVDATGISTFREGFGVGPLTGIALTAYKDGSIRSTGIITASTFGSDTNSIFTTGGTERLRIDSGGRFLKGVTSSEASRSNTSARNPHFQLSSPWSSGLGAASITCTDDYPILFLNSNATFQDNAGAGVITFSVKDGAGNYCNTASINSQIDGTPGNNDSPGELSFRTSDDGACNPVERVRISHNGHLSINDGNLVIGTAGKGIDFSAQTQSSSTTDDEILDHYEKGKWTPVIKKNGVANGTATIIHGRYVRIGMLCWLSMYARWNSGSNAQGTSGGWTIHGLPFTLQDDDPGSCRIYQSAPAGYMMIDGTDYAYGDNPRWQINTGTYFDLYTSTSSADQAWTTGMMIVAMTGCFMIHE